MSGGLATKILNPCVAVFGGDEESVTLTVKENVPVCVGDPEIAPAPDRDNPGASEPPEMDHEYGVVPPVATNDAL